MHSGRRPEQADAGRPGCQRRRFLRRSGTNRVYRRAQHLCWPLRVFRIVPAEWRRPLGAASRSGNGISRRGAELQALSLRPAAARGDRCRAGGSRSAPNRGGDDIAAVTIETDPAGYSDQFERGPAKRRPTQVVEAQFAQPFLVATAMVHGKVGIAEVDGLGDPAVQALSDRVAGIPCEDRKKGTLSITVTRTDGRSVTVEASDPIGSPQKPLTNAQFKAKFRDCARNAVAPLSDETLDAVLTAIRRLETLPDARELTTPFAG